MSTNSNKYFINQIKIFLVNRRYSNRFCAIIETVYDFAFCFGFRINVHCEYKLCADRWNGDRKMGIDNWYAGFASASISLHSNGDYCLFYTKLAPLTVNHFDTVVCSVTVLVSFTSHMKILTKMLKMYI